MGLRSTAQTYTLVCTYACVDLANAGIIVNHEAGWSCPLITVSVRVHATQQLPRNVTYQTRAMGKFQISVRFVEGRKHYKNLYTHAQVYELV